MKKKLFSLVLVCALVLTVWGPITTINNDGAQTWGILDWSTGEE